MTAKAIYEKFKNEFGYLDLATNVVSYKEINGDNHSIRITMKNGTTYIFTYPPNGHYKLEVDKNSFFKTEARKKREQEKEYMYEYENVT